MRVLFPPASRGVPRAGIPGAQPSGALVISVLWAVGDELHQAFVPSRSPSITDVGIDTLGVLLGQILGGISTRRQLPDGDAGPGR